MQNEKNLYFQELRAVCVIAVIFIHSISFSSESSQTNFDFLLVFRQFINFPVAFFFFLSGYFTTSTTYKGIFKRIKRLLIPFLIWTSIYWGVALLQNREWNFRDIIFSFFNGSGPGYHLYYLVVMFQLVILTPILIKIISSSKKWIKIATFLLTPIFLIFVYWINLNQIDFLYRSIFINWLLFFLLGIYIRKNECVFQRIPMIRLIGFLMFALLLSIWESIYMYQNLGSIGFATSQIKFSSYLFSVSLILLLQRCQYHVKNKSFLVIIGNYSFGIYLIHLGILWIPAKIFSFCNITEYISNSLFLLIIKAGIDLAVSLLIVIVLVKMLPTRWTNYLGLK